MTDRGRLRIGLNLPTWPGRDGTYMTWAGIRRLARDAESLGVDTLWVPDHLLRRLPGRPPYGFWECWTILTAAAEATERIEIGPFVACTGFRAPGLLAKMAATLDEVSGGRLILGLGSGVPATDQSWASFGYDGAGHVGRFAEAVEVIARLLRERSVTFSGEAYRLVDAELIPRGRRPSGPPIWVAAKGRRTAAIAARWGDVVNVNTAIVTQEDVVAVRERIADACREVARDPATLPVTGWGRLALRPDGSGVVRDGWIGGGVGEMVDTLRSLRAAGLRDLALYLGTEDDSSPMPALSQAALDRFVRVFEALTAA
jgi:alkanesulfonate monooxygenase SsuD/methylene tetrahydromethanopterin reductase-like flavin-dependent oxidoreductase (luciferase family)